MGKIGELLGIPLGWVMYWIYEFVGNYGFAIILFTLLTKIIMIPFSYKQQLGTARRQLLNPMINNLRKQYANNPQKLQEEQMKLYQKEGISQTEGCMPLLVTMIVLYGVLDVVYRPLTHILRIKDSFLNEATEICKTLVDEKLLKNRPELTILAQIKENPNAFSSLDEGIVNKIAEFKNTFLGIDLGAIPTISPDTWDKASVALIMIPILSGVTQLGYTIYSQYKMRKSNPDMANMQGQGCMNVMLYGMPLFSVWLACTVPAGVGFYWIWSTVFAFVQTLVLYMYLTPKRVEVINNKLKEKNKDKKPGFMERMMEQQNELMKQQGMVQQGRPDYIADTEGMSRSEKQNYNRQLINEARKRMAEKYGEEYNDEE